MSKVSVIIPVFHRERNIEKSIESVLNQTYRDIEIIVVVDRSSDKTENIVYRLAQINPNIRVFVCETEQGPGKAKNLGIDMAQGEYLFFLDADDYIRKNTIQLLINNINEYPFVGSFMEMVNEKNYDEIELLYKTSNDDRVRIEELNKTRQTIHFHPLGILYKKDFLQRQSCRFYEDVISFHGAPLVNEMLKSGKQPVVMEAFYYKLTTKKDVSNPSRTQESYMRNRKDWYTVYLRLLTNPQNKKLKKYYTEVAYNRFHKNLRQLKYQHIVTEEKLFNDVFVLWGKLVQEIEKLSNEQKENKLIKFILTQDITKFKNLIKKREKKQLWQKLFTSIGKNRKVFNESFYNLFLKKLPVKKNLIFYESFFGESYSDSPAAIYEYLIQNYPKKFKHVWEAEKGVEVKGTAKTVERFSLKYYYYVSRASVWVTNTRFPLKLYKNKHTLYLQCWHGTPLKKLFLDMPMIYGVGWGNESKVVEESSRWDYLVSPNRFYSTHMRSAFNYKGPILESGYPRNDRLYNDNNEEKILKIKRELGIATDKKVVLYAPTWREDTSKANGKHSFDLNLDLEKMRQLFGHDTVVLLRLHYHVSNNLTISETDDMFLNVSDYYDISYLYLISDILITDYSSVMFDYAHLERPMVFFMYDKDDYVGRLRGSYIDNIEEVLPGPIVNSNEELFDILKTVDQWTHLYDVKYRKFYQQFCQLGEGESSQLVVEKVILPWTQDSLDESEYQQKDSIMESNT